MKRESEIANRKPTGFTLVELLMVIAIIAIIGIPVALVSNDNGATDFDRLPETAVTHKGRMALLAYDLAADGSAKFREVLADKSLYRIRLNKAGYELPGSRP